MWFRFNAKAEPVRAVLVSPPSDSVVAGCLQNLTSACTGAISIKRSSMEWGRYVWTTSRCSPFKTGIALHSRCGSL